MPDGPIHLDRERLRRAVAAGLQSELCCWWCAPFAEVVVVVHPLDQHRVSQPLDVIALLEPRQGRIARLGGGEDGVRPIYSLEYTHIHTFIHKHTETTKDRFAAARGRIEHGGRLLHGGYGADGVVDGSSRAVEGVAHGCILAVLFRHGSVVGRVTAAGVELEIVDAWCVVRGGVGVICGWVYLCV